jgi:3-carboxy-cis,cis-muconate cycloisomerase
VPTTLDCELLRDVYGTEEARAAFDTRALVQGWLDAERALAEAEAECGVIPEEAARRIAQEADATLYDVDALRAGIAESQHPLVPLVRALVERCGEHGAWVHWGATTQDIIDTGLVLQVRRAAPLLDRDLERAVAAAAELARRYRDAVMAGRTHGQHAVPTTFGLRAAGWADELGRARERLARAVAELPAELAGAAGTLASLEDAGGAVRRAYARRLDLPLADLPWHVARDRVRDLGFALAQLSAAAERIAADVVRLQATEVAEAAEPLAPGHVGSSTMPQKQNPMVSEYLVASARLLRGSVAVLTEAAPHAHERDMALWAVEWLAVPQAVILAAGTLDKLASILEGLRVFPERMAENLAATRGQIMAEAAMMRLARALGHEEAHALVARAARSAWDARRPLLDVLAETPDVAAVLTRDELEAALRAEAYLGLAGSFVDAVTRPA